MDKANIDPITVSGFGSEWAAYDQSDLSPAEHREIFQRYFSIFPFGELAANAEGFDLGCGSGRWAALAAERVGKLHCIDPAEQALAVARRRLSDRANVDFHHASSDTIPLPDGSQDFGYSLGVLHHIPDTERAMRDCVAKLKPGAPFLVYLYYSFDNRPAWFRAIWGASNVLRKGIWRLPFPLRKGVTAAIATTIYWPLARTARTIERLGGKVDSFPLSAYRHNSFYTMRTDALDRFGTRLEQRFSRAQIQEMMQRAGLTRIEFRDDVPFWVACGRRAST
jgi:ubiquinone/menaquinone biosynthesis C-methylase UbiE